MGEDRLGCAGGAAVAGHVIECSAQATGGNYSFIEEVPSFKNVGFPIAELETDGSSVITKHPGHRRARIGGHGDRTALV